MHTTSARRRCCFRRFYLNVGEMDGATNGTERLQFVEMGDVALWRLQYSFSMSTSRLGTKKS